MAAQSFSINIESINVYKFKGLQSGKPIVADKQNSLNIMPQVVEVSLYESIFRPLMKCELVVNDFIGLFVNFPLTGEEIVEITYENIGDMKLGNEATSTRSWLFAIDEIRDISFKDDSRAMSYIISCVAIEGLANSLGTVQQFYHDKPIEISRKIFYDHIVNRIKQFFPSYKEPMVWVEDNDLSEHTIVIPNMHPLAAIDMVNDLTYSQTKNKYSYLFYQTNNGFSFRTLQDHFMNQAQRTWAYENRYKYFSNEIAELDSRLNNQERIVSKIAINRRHSSMQKIATGYFNNNLFEINIAQKAVHSTKTDIDSEHLSFIEDNKLNTRAYIDWNKSFNEGDDVSNRTRFAVTTRPENDENFIVYQAREKWGKDLIAKIALAQVDITTVIPGTNRFVAGDLFHIELPEFHGFVDLDIDKFISGTFIITEIKHIILIGGIHTTILKINKDSYGEDPDMPSRYVSG